MERRESEGRREDRRGGGSHDRTELHGQEKLQVTKGFVAGEEVSRVLVLPNLDTYLINIITRLYVSYMGLLGLEITATVPHVVTAPNHKIILLLHN